MLLERHRRYIQYAFRLANTAPLQHYRLGCIIVKGSTPISSGVNNMKKTHPRAINYYYPFIHAELAALIAVDAEELRGSIAYVARRTATGTMGLAKPCEFCEEQFRRVGIKGVYYSTDTGIEYIDLR